MRVKIKVKSASSQLNKYLILVDKHKMTKISDVLQHIQQMLKLQNDINMYEGQYLLPKNETTELISESVVYDVVESPKRKREVEVVEPKIVKKMKESGKNNVVRKKVSSSSSESSVSSESSDSSSTPVVKIAKNESTRNSSRQIKEVKPSSNLVFKKPEVKTMKSVENNVKQVEKVDRIRQNKQIVQPHVAPQPQRSGKTQNRRNAQLRPQSQSLPRPQRRSQPHLQPYSQPRAPIQKQPEEYKVQKSSIPIAVRRQKYRNMVQQAKQPQFLDIPIKILQFTRKHHSKSFLENDQQIQYQTTQLDLQKFIPKLSQWKKATICSISPTQQLTLKHQDQQTLSLCQYNLMGLQIKQLTAQQQQILTKYKQDTPEKQNRVEQGKSSPQSKQKVVQQTPRRDIVLQQVDYYFSDKNYNNDDYLIMHAAKHPQLYIDMAIILNFPKIKKMDIKQPELVQMLRQDDNPKRNYELHPTENRMRKKGLRIE